MHLRFRGGCPSTRDSHFADPLLMSDFFNKTSPLIIFDRKTEDIEHHSRVTEECTILTMQFESDTSELDDVRVGNEDFKRVSIATLTILNDIRVLKSLFKHL